MTSTQTLTPSQIDEQLAELYLAQHVNDARREQTINAIHSAVDSREYVRGDYRRKGYYRNTMTNAAAIAELRSRVEATRALMAAHPDDLYDEANRAEFLALQVKPWNLDQQAGYLDRLEQIDAEDARIWAATKPLNDEYNRRPWSRFFRVTSSAGHVHSSMRCSTCYPAT